eukprot:TRINITY_DN5979_c1_g1_i1.p1 TRINITY_DN5979_c1_g1~~TRINITY_DN5979_c1_g1_i1.p1  ORF type:complete len:343 (-),score=58.89 TRINITY_DN5979_c1_g1_i1:786-1700(-)
MGRGGKGKGSWGTGWQQQQHNQWTPYGKGSWQPEQAAADPFAAIADSFDRGINAMTTMNRMARIGEALAGNPSLLGQSGAPTNTAAHRAATGASIPGETSVMSQSLISSLQKEPNVNATAQLSTSVFNEMLSANPAFKAMGNRMEAVETQVISNTRALSEIQTQQKSDSSVLRELLSSVRQMHNEAADDAPPRGAARVVPPEDAGAEVAETDPASMVKADRVAWFCNKFSISATRDVAKLEPLIEDPTDGAISESVFCKSIMKGKDMAQWRVKMKGLGVDAGTVDGWRSTKEIFAHIKEHMWDM